MAKAQLQCPSCQGMVTLGEITCPHCGVNLKSGESYETQVKRARGKSKHQETYTGGLYAGIVVAVTAVLFAGYMYQRSMESVMAQRGDIFKPRIAEFQQVEDLVGAGQYAEARTRGEALAQQLQADADAITPETPFRVDQVTAGYSSNIKPKEEWNKRGTKRLLLNLKAKTQYLLDHLPAT